MNEEGFSLIEALVAMLVLAVASAGLIRASEAHVDTIGRLEQRSAAEWVAQNRLVELGLPGALPANAENDVAMLGQTWHVSVRVKASEDPDLRRATVSVTEKGKAEPLVVLDGFVDAGSTTP